MKSAPLNSELEVIYKPLVDTDPKKHGVGDGAVTPLDERSIDWMWILWNRRRSLFGATLIGLLVGTLAAFLIPNKFQSTTQLMPPDSQSSTAVALMAGLSGKTGDGLGAIAGDLLGLQSSGALFIGILRSRTVEDHLIDSFDLRRVYGVRLEEKARRELDENTAISEDRKSGIITITVTDNDPSRAASMAKAYVTELDRLVAKLSTSSARREREFLEERIRTVQADLELAEKDFSQFASKNTAIDIKEQGKAMVEAAATLEGQLIAAKSELEGLKRIYADNHVRVRATQARVDELQFQLEKLGGKGDVAPAGSSDGGSLYPSIRKLPLLGVTFADLYRRTRVQEAVFEALTRQYELAKVQEVKETPSVKVLDEPRVPERKSYPPRLVIIVLCAFLAFAFVALYSLGRSRWNEIDANDSTKILATQVLQLVRAQMPWAEPNGSRLQLMTHSMWMRLRRNGSSQQVHTEANDGHAD
jgi:capsule polysaccharide export protein KpsE/RkpR